MNSDSIFLDKKDINSELSAALKEAEEARKEAEAAKKSNDAKSAFLAGISHELRTPLNAILGYAELLLTGRPLPTAAQEDVRRISEAGKTLLEIVNNLLDLSKIESGQFTITEDIYEVKKLIDELSSSVILAIKDKPIDFSVEVSEDMPNYLYGDVVVIKRIIMNLLSNAAKYTDSGFITMRMRYAEGNLCVEIIDTGIGIKEEDIPKVFEKFERLDSQINHNIEGTGLGLALTKDLVSQTNGTISVSSIYGEGSNFSVCIPQSKSDSETQYDKEETTVTAPGISVLVVDDNAVNLTVAQRLLSRFDLNVECAESGELCLAMLQANSYDCILMDHMMPEMDGVETLHKLRQMPGLEKQIVFALTANAMKGMHEFFLEQGFDDYMPKPISLDSIKSMIKKWVPENKLIEKQVSSDSEEMPEILTQCTGIDIKSAMSFSGNYTDLITTIKGFSDLIDMKSNQIECLARDEDVLRFTIEVHALKSSSRLIGATELSKKAEYLEACGKENKIDEIHTLTPELLELYTSYKNHLKPVIDSLTSNSEKIEITNEQLIEELTNLRNMLSDFDLDGAEEWSEKADVYLLENDTDEIVKAIRTDIQMIDYLGGIKHIDILLEKLKSI